MDNIICDEIPASTLIRAIHPDTSSKGHVVLQYDVARQLIRTKARPEELRPLIAGTIPPSRHLQVSCSTYSGKAILLNAVQSRALTVSLDTSKRPDLSVSDPSTLFQKLCWHLRSKDVPPPSALVVSGSKATIIYILDEPVDFGSFHELYTAELGLNQLLTSFGAQTDVQSGSRFIDIPSRSAVFGAPVHIVGRPSAPTVSKSRIFRSSCSNVRYLDGEVFMRSIEFMEELSCLLFARFIEVSQKPELYPLWATAFATAAMPLVRLREFQEISRSVIESLENRFWQSARNRRSEQDSITYLSLVDRLTRAFREDYVRLGNSPSDLYPIQDQSWMQMVGERLSVSQREANELQLRHLLPPRMVRHESGYFHSPRKGPLGIDDFIPLPRFLMAA